MLCLITLWRCHPVEQGTVTYKQCKKLKFNQLDVLLQVQGIHIWYKAIAYKSWSRKNNRNAEKGTWTFRQRDVFKILNGCGKNSQFISINKPLPQSPWCTSQLHREQHSLHSMMFVCLWRSISNQLPTYALHIIDVNQAVNWTVYDKEEPEMGNTLFLARISDSIKSNKTITYTDSLTSARISFIPSDASSFPWPRTRRRRMMAVYHKNKLVVRRYKTGNISNQKKISKSFFYIKKIKSIVVLGGGSKNWLLFIHQFLVFDSSLF